MKIALVRNYPMAISLEPENPEEAEILRTIQRELDTSPIATFDLIIGGWEKVCRRINFSEMKA